VLLITGITGDFFLLKPGHMLGVMLWHYGSYFSFLFYLSFAGIVLAGKG
jgi:hypothetical protein